MTAEKGYLHHEAVLALARLKCDAVLDDALGLQNVEALGHIGGSDYRAVNMVERRAYGWFTERYPRIVAVEALAQMGRLPTPTKAGLFAHIFVVLAVVFGLVLLVIPRGFTTHLAGIRVTTLRMIGFTGLLAGLFMLYMLHFRLFF